MFGSPIELSPYACKKVNELMIINALDENFRLRIGVKGSGCTGTTYFLGFDQINNDDKEFEVHGIKILIAKRHYLYLVGIEIDYIDDNSQTGFTFTLK